MVTSQTANKKTLPRTKRSLRLRISIVVGLTLLIFLGAILTTVMITVNNLLLQSEERYLREQLDLVEGLFDDARTNAHLMADDTGVWVETVDFVEGNNPDYIKNNWTGAGLLEAYQFNFLQIESKDGSFSYTDGYDYFSGEPIPFPAALQAHTTAMAASLLARYESGAVTQNASLMERSAGGIYETDGVYYYIAMHPVMGYYGDKIYGTLAFGIILSDDFFKSITHYDISFEVLSYALNADIDTITRNAKEGRVSSALVLENNGTERITLIMHDDRVTYKAGQRYIWIVCSMLAAAVLLCFGLLLFIVLRLVVKPVESLSSELATVSETGGVNTEKFLSSSELYNLSVSINEMVTGLSQSRISLSAFQSILDGMDANIYVSDPETDALLFINAQMRKVYNVQDYAGKKCWELLQNGNTERCDFCKKGELLASAADREIRWEEHSTFNEHFYSNCDRLIPWQDGRLVHMQSSMDITHVRKSELAAQERLKQQELLSGLSQSFISNEDTDTLIHKALAMMGSYMGADKMVIAGVDLSGSYMEYRYGWMNPNLQGDAMHVRSTPFCPGNIFYDTYILNHRPYCLCENTQTASNFGTFKIPGVKAYLNVPIYTAGTFWGALTVSDCKKARSWEKGEIHLMQLFANMLAGVVARQEAENALVRMSAIVDASPQLVAHLDAEGTLSYLNKGGEELVGYTAEELQERGWHILFHDADYEHLRTEVAPLAFREEQRAEFLILRKDGTERIVLLSLFPTEGGVKGIGIIASDVTEKRLLEQELVKAKEVAEDSSRAKGDFLARMSHEMRTPMNAIIGMTGIANAATDIERKNYCLQKIEEASNHLLGVINDILDMAKIEANKFELSFSEFNLEKTLVRVTNVINFRVEEKKQSLLVRLANNVPTLLRSDEQRITQVITNLLSNAVKFTPEGGKIELSVSCVEDADPETGTCILQVSVADTGIGIAPEDQKKLFRSFEQADGGIARRFGGTGLGLAISKHIVEMLNGKIWVESEAGKGSVFRFTMCVEPRGNAVTAKPVDFSALHVLAVDDAPEILEYFASLAASVGFRCETAANGKEACAILERSADDPFHVAFIDWRMPEMDGIALTRYVKETRPENTVVIMISATEWQEIASEARAAGVDKFVAKPLFSSVLLDCMQDALSGQDADTAEQTAGAAKETESFTDRFAGKYLLLAEDVEINREIVISLLADTGLHIDSAENGIEAVRMFQENPDRYDMIFMDIHMPEMDGYEATRQIRALPLPRATKIPIVAMTANVFRNDIERCLEAGMDGHIGKPLDINEVLAQLKKYLEAAS